MVFGECRDPAMMWLSQASLPALPTESAGLSTFPTLVSCFLIPCPRSRYKPLLLSLLKQAIWTLLLLTDFGRPWCPVIRLTLISSCALDCLGGPGSRQCLCSHQLWHSHCGEGTHYSTFFPPGQKDWYAGNTWKKPNNWTNSSSTEMSNIIWITSILKDSID